MHDPIQYEIFYFTEFEFAWPLCYIQICKTLLSTLTLDENCMVQLMIVSIFKFILPNKIDDVN